MLFYLIIIIFAAIFKTLKRITLKNRTMKKGKGKFKNKGKLLITLFLLNVLGNQLIAQENLTFTKVIQTDSISSTDLFIKVNDWFATVYNTANKVIQMADKDAGIIIGNGAFIYSYGKFGFSCYDGFIEYTIKVYVKDNRFKVEMTNFNHTVDINHGCPLGLITTAEVYTTTGISKNYHNKVWNDIKVKAEAYSNEIFKALENNIKESGQSDW